MSERPSPEQVDAAQHALDAGHLSYDRWVAEVLAAEVVALRAEATETARLRDALEPFVGSAAGPRRLEIGRHVAMEIRVTERQYEDARAALAATDTTETTDG